MILHTVELSTEIGRHGVHVNQRQGDAVDVSGSLYVSLWDGSVLRRADGWHESRAAALTAAADRIQGWAHLLMNQAEELRREAAT